MPANTLLCSLVLNHPSAAAVLPAAPATQRSPLVATPPSIQVLISPFVELEMISLLPRWEKAAVSKMRVHRSKTRKKGEQRVIKIKIDG